MKRLFLLLSLLSFFSIPFRSITKLSLLTFYLQAVDSLEARILELKAEKRFGTREIDQIEGEMKDMRNEITRLRRRYLNYFYYF